MVLKHSEVYPFRKWKRSQWWTDGRSRLTIQIDHRQVVGYMKSVEKGRKLTHREQKADPLNSNRIMKFLNLVGPFIRIAKIGPYITTFCVYIADVSWLSYISFFFGLHKSMVDVICRDILRPSQDSLNTPRTPLFFPEEKKCHCAVPTLSAVYCFWSHKVKHLARLFILTRADAYFLIFLRCVATTVKRYFNINFSRRGSSYRVVKCCE